jgi:hypothetical protein
MRKKPEGETAHRGNGAPPHATTSEKAPEMAVHAYQNGADPSPDRAPRNLSFDEKLGAFIRGNWKVLVTCFTLLGGAAILPVGRWQFEKYQAEVTGKFTAIEQKLADHEKAIGEIKAAETRIESKIDALLLKMTPLASAPAVTAPPRRGRSLPGRKKGFLER